MMRSQVFALLFEELAVSTVQVAQLLLLLKEQSRISPNFYIKNLIFS